MVKGFNKYTRPGSRGGAQETTNSLSRLDLKNQVGPSKQLQASNAQSQTMQARN